MSIEDLEQMMICMINGLCPTSIQDECACGGGVGYQGPAADTSDLVFHVGVWDLEIRFDNGRYVHFPVAISEMLLNYDMNKALCVLLSAVSSAALFTERAGRLLKLIGQHIMLKKMLPVPCVDVMQRELVDNSKRLIMASHIYNISLMIAKDDELRAVRSFVNNMIYAAQRDWPEVKAAYRDANHTCLSEDCERCSPPASILDRNKLQVWIRWSSEKPQPMSSNVKVTNIVFGD